MLALWGSALVISVLLDQSGRKLRLELWDSEVWSVGLYLYDRIESCFEPHESPM
jgi:hypothetical protein